MFPPGSWPWTTLRVFAFVHGTPEANAVWRSGIANEVASAAADPQTGPLSSLAMTYASGFVFGHSAQTRIACTSLQRFDEADVQRDAELLASGDHGLARLVRAAIRTCDDLSDGERAELVEATPEPWRELLEALLKRRAAHADESPEASLDAALVEAWTGSLRDHAHAELSRMAGQSVAPGEYTAQQPAANTTE
jgi:hypothetical protein